MARSLVNATAAKAAANPITAEIRDILLAEPNDSRWRVSARSASAVCQSRWACDSSRCHRRCSSSILICRNSCGEIPRFHSSKSSHSIGALIALIVLSWSGNVELKFEPFVGLVEPLPPRLAAATVRDADCRRQRCYAVADQRRIIFAWQQLLDFGIG